jgi:hypothetical protein
LFEETVKNEQIIHLDISKVEELSDHDFLAGIKTSDLDLYAAVRIGDRFMQNEWDQITQEIVNPTNWTWGHELVGTGQTIPMEIRILDDDGFSDGFFWRS